jgi:uncharacterized membrane protein YgdD (TMEM256/DUF423 family)
MYKLFRVLGATLAGLAVALGAFGAHGLQQLTQEEKIIQTYQTGVQYQLWHAIALLIVGLPFFANRVSYFKWAGISFITGILFFSGSLYAITYLRLHQLPVGWWGPVTPLGGLFFILGWILLAIAFFTNEKSN